MQPFINSTWHVAKDSLHAQLVLQAERRIVPSCYLHLLIGVLGIIINITKIARLTFKHNQWNTLLFKQIFNLTTFPLVSYYQLSPTTLWWLSQFRTWIYICICGGIVVFNCLRWEVIGCLIAWDERWLVVRFVDISGTVHHHCFNFLVILFMLMSVISKMHAPSNHIVNFKRLYNLFYFQTCKH